MEGDGNNWSEAVENLVEDGEVEAAISLLQTLISKLRTQKPSSPQLTSALHDLSKLNSSHILGEPGDTKKNIQQQEGVLCDDALRSNGPSEEDWEAIADLEANELLSPQSLPGVSDTEHPVEETKLRSPKRRGRGTFLYKKHSLYSDQQCEESSLDDPEEAIGHVSEGSTGRGNLVSARHGTHHVLVLADISPSTRTTELEKLFEKFNDRGVVIRWVNDTVALAVFPTPSIALEACNSTRCPFTVRGLDEDDTLLSSISNKDLEPPLRRPETSARTAQRLIAQGMGVKLPSTKVGSSSEFRKQEEARKNRIVTRQNLRDDAWGD